jgi:predicted ATP-binding protein involved in virulence
MRIKSIAIEKLFGTFDYNIDLNQDEGITILTGPNGYGKTTILHIINSIYRRDLNYLKSLKANKIALVFENGGSIWFNDGKNAKQFGYSALSIYNDFWSGNKEKIYGIAFIKDQRLTHEITYQNANAIASGAFHAPEGKGIASTVFLYANEMRSILGKKKSEDNQLSEKLNATQFNRIKDCVPLETNEYKSRFEIFQEKYNRLLAMGIYSEPLQYADYNENRQYLTIFLEDFEKKIAIYDDILIRAELFLEILNEKALTNKHLFIDVRNGFTIKTRGNEKIDLLLLSSGEQQEIILFFDLIFLIKQEALVLIDEPETSLHIVWQRQFVNDLIKIRQASKNLSFIIATHSPQIIAKHRGLCADLYDLSLADNKNA